MQPAAHVNQIPLLPMPHPVTPKKWMGALITFEVSADAKKITVAAVAVFVALGALLCLIGLPTAGIVLGLSGLLVIPFRAHQIDRFTQGKQDAAVKVLAKGKDMATFAQVPWKMEGVHKTLTIQPREGLPKCFVGRADNHVIFAGFANEEASRFVVVPLDRTYQPLKWIFESQGNKIELKKKVFVTKDSIS
ncbi:MAG: hypothetical protein LLG04_04945 [Parachlamydia sp.]|nr:hypothetical protein [Parachlamydia sp.]